MHKIYYYYYRILSLSLYHFYHFWENKQSILKNGVILMFHHITDEDMDISPSCKCTISQFTSILDWLENKHIPIISLDEYLAHTQRYKKGGFAILTFDDISENVYEIAYPILKKRKLPFTVYIATNFLDKPGYIKKEQLLKLNQESLCTNGSHSVTHCYLRHSKELKKELNESKEILEKLTGKKISHFAYPYGTPFAVSLKTIYTVWKSSYCSAVSAIPSTLNKLTANMKFYLPRIDNAEFLKNITKLQ